MGLKDGFPGKGTAIFALGYFLKSAAGKTEIPLENVVYVLSGHSDVDDQNNNVFLDSAEIIALTIEAMNTIIGVKELLNGLRI